MRLTGIGKAALCSLCCLITYTYTATQHVVYASQLSACNDVIRNFNCSEKGDPVITGEAFIIPSLKFRVTDSKTGKPVSKKQVVVRYVWRWFQYPYPDHPLGAWLDAYDLIECSTDEAGYLVLPEYKLVPRGWYNGKHLLGRKPKFKELELSLENHHLWMTLRQLDQAKKMKEGKKPVVLSRPDKFEGPFRIEVFAAKG